MSTPLNTDNTTTSTPISTNSNTNILQLPLSKIKRIAKTDPEYILTSQQAYILTGLATQLFIEKFVEDITLQSQLSYAGNKSKSKAKSKIKSINGASNNNIRLTYEDISNVVAKVDKYQFLGDIIPETKPLINLVRENKVRYSILEEGQQMLPFNNASDNKNPTDGEKEEQHNINGVDNEDFEMVTEEEDSEDGENGQSGEDSRDTNSAEEKSSTDDSDIELNTY
ncbi:uncharacterized protein SCODWIG_00376 [Saccharomycodes ludwigii]|uniref:DNA polymerase epsilon subunit C n=1 Tax=Saccharomycodes ludwigii TaxID=36035 RepID=A0A376B1Q6_9ASCO|nr:uncharacterized protein SCODWIG_00376 [Saccharomycodes ludwigii]